MQMIGSRTEKSIRSTYDLRDMSTDLMRSVCSEFVDFPLYLLCVTKCKDALQMIYRLH